jgi:hypothetical protein
MAKAKSDGVTKFQRQAVVKKTSDGCGRNSRPTNKSKKRSTKPYRGQGRP